MCANFQNISKKEQGASLALKEQALLQKNKPCLQKKTSPAENEKRAGPSPCSKRKKSRAFALLQKKKEQGFRPAPKIVSTLFPRKFGFDLD